MVKEVKGNAGRKEGRSKGNKARMKEGREEGMTELQSTVAISKDTRNESNDCLVDIYIQAK